MMMAQDNKQDHFVIMSEQKQNKNTTNYKND